jgi:Fe-S cluster assembly protein SufB
MDNRQKEIDNLKDYKYGFSTDIENTRAPKGLNEDVINLFQILKKNLNGCLILD